VTTVCVSYLQVLASIPNKVFTVLIWGENRSKFGTPGSELVKTRSEKVLPRPSAMKTACQYLAARLLLMVLALRAVPQPVLTAEIPLRVNHTFGLILLKAEINGNPAVLVLDTGSNRTSVSSRFVDVATPRLTDTVSGAKGSGYVGTAVYAKASLKVGTLIWRDQQILAMDMSQISKSLGENVDGMLGMDFLNQFTTVVVDLKAHKLILTR
jgi:Aspartyl protease